MAPNKKGKPAAKPKPHRATGKPRGRPTGGGFHGTEDQKKLVQAMAGWRIAEDEMCLLVINPDTKRPISPMTLRKHFAEEIRTGFVTGKSRVMAATFRNALGETRQRPDGTTEVVREGNVTAQIWLGKCLYGMREYVDALPPAASAGDENLLDSARRVAFTLAMGARLEQQRHKPAPKK